MSKYRLLKVSIILLLLFSPAMTLSAQEYCLALSANNILESEARVNSSIQPSQVFFYAFEVEAGEVWRFDIETNGTVQLDFYYSPPPENFVAEKFYSYATLRNDNAQYSTAFLFDNNYRVCLSIKNEADSAAVNYEFSLSHLLERNGRLQGVDGISSSYGNNSIGNYYLGLGDYEAAYGFYQRAIERNPNDAAGWSNSCNALLNMGNYNLALDDCNNAIVIEPDLLSGLANRGSVYNALGYYGMALIDFEHLMRLEPDSYFWPFLASIQNLFIGRGNAALEEMEQYTELVSDDPFNEFVLGLANLSAGNYEDASQHFERSTEERNGPIAFDSLWLGLSYRLEGREDDAEEAFDDAARAVRRLDEEDNAGQIRFYNIFENLINGDVEAAQDITSDLLDEFPYAHENLYLRLYLAILPELFPDEPAYAEMRDWLNNELNIES